MQHAFQQQQTEQSNLSEYRINRVRQLEKEIIQQYQNLANAALALGVALKAFRDEKLWQVDGYTSMTHYVSVRWPNLSKRRLYQLLEAAEIAEMIEEHNAGGVQIVHSSDDGCTNGKLPPIQNEGQARALAEAPPDQRLPIYADASAAANGHTPTAKQITEARVSRLDASPSHKTNFHLTGDGTPNQQTIGETFVKAETNRSGKGSRPFGYIPLDSVCTDHERQRVILSFYRPAVPDRKLREVTVPGLSIPWHVLENQGWTPPTAQYKKDLEAFNDQRNPFMGKSAEPEEDLFEPDSLVDDFFAHETTP